MKHLTKRRASTPIRRPPTKRKIDAGYYDEHLQEVDDTEEWSNSQLPELTQVGEEILVWWVIFICKMGMKVLLSQ